LTVLLATERNAVARERVRRLLPPPTREEWVRQQIDISAATVLAGAEVKYHQLSLTNSAAADYRRVCEMYPDTISAKTAAIRLEVIGRESPMEPVE